jgi:hypothetical protein
MMKNIHFLPEVLRRGMLTALLTMVIYTAFYVLNVNLFYSMEFSQGIAWVYMPAGVRLLCILMFAEAGGIGIFFASLLTASFYDLFPDDPIAMFGYSLISALSPYLVYRFMTQVMGLQRSLTALTPAKLIQCGVLFAIMNPLLQLIWFTLRDVSYHFWENLTVMSLGDLLGSAIVLYLMKFLLSLMPRLR